MTLTDNREGDDPVAHVRKKYKETYPRLETAFQHHKEEQITLEQVIAIIRSSIDDEDKNTTTTGTYAK